VKTELEKLIELQKTDTKIRRLKESIDTAEERRAQIEQQFNERASSIRELQDQRKTLREAQADLDNQIITTKTYIELSNRNLKNAQDQKQYETAMREVDSLQKQVSKLETEVLEKMTEIEEIDKVLAEQADEISSLETDQEAALKIFDEELKQNKIEHEAATQKRDEIFLTLPAQKASVYNRLAQRSRDGIAVAEVINGSCSACFMSLRPQMQVELNTSQHIITCESCARILYVNPESKAATQES
jgi:predicted  nucleic acid-binding Zn-ribbon protein